MVTRLSFQMNNTMKSSSAYLVFYRKKTVKAADKEVSTNAGSQSDSSHTRKRKKDEEAAGGDCYTVDKQENKKRIVDNNRDTEIKTGDDKPAVKRENILVKNNHGEGQDNVDQTSQESTADYQNSEQTTRHKQSMRSKGRNPSKQHHNKDVKHQGEETLDNVRQNKTEDQEGKQEQDSVRVDKQRNEEKPVKDVKVDEDITPEASEREKASVSGKGNSDPCHGFQKNEGVGDCEENMSKNQGISNTSPTRHEQPGEENRDVKKDKKQMTIECKYAQMGDTSMTHQDSRKLGDVREEQRSRQNSLVENRTANDFSQNKPNDAQEGKQGESRDSDRDRQQKRGHNECTQRKRTSGSHGSEGVEDKPQERLEKEIGHKDVGDETRIKVAEKCNRHIQNRKESFRQTGSAGSRDLTENQRVHSGQMRPCDQYKRQGDTAEEGSELYSLKKNVMEDRGGQLSDDKRKGEGEFSPKAEHESKKKRRKKGRKSWLERFSCGLLRKRKRDRHSESE
ncbi:pre-mRNA-splicing factor 38B-like [Thunnus albacares]|uniref:pre-mRNA-splicing factor 38B-like n=1 Tax=Thunnus albacares TaxID=8236 RepID=UPI001CF63623|nr:pre-mRNA-splicing factor 38B-like [Thunnus albacares]